MPTAQNDTKAQIGHFERGFSWKGWVDHKEIKNMARKNLPESYMCFSPPERYFQEFGLGAEKGGTACTVNASWRLFRKPEILHRCFKCETKQKIRIHTFTVQMVHIALCCWSLWHHVTGGAAAKTAIRFVLLLVFPKGSRTLLIGWSNVASSCVFGLARLLVLPFQTPLAHHPSSWPSIQGIQKH